MNKPLATCRDILVEFQTIFHLEKKAADVYHQLALDCDDPEVAEMLEKISKEELEHYEIAKKLVSLAEGFIKQKLSESKVGDIVPPA